MRYLNKTGNGILVILRYDQSDEEVLQDLARVSNDKKQKPKNEGHLRLLGAGSQILSNLGVRKMKVIGSQKKMHALSGFDLEIVDYISNIDD